MVRVAVIGKFQYPCAMEEYWARGFETLGCEVYRDRGLIGGMDLSFAVKVDWLDPAQMSGKRVLYWCDLTKRFPAFLELAPHYDFAYTVHDEHLTRPQRPAELRGPVEYQWLPMGYDPRDYPHLPATKKTCDVMFAGTYRPEREWIRTLFDNLRKRGLNCALFGNGWGPGVADIYGEGLRRAVAASKVCLNSHYPGDDLNMRALELLAMGAFQMSDQAPGWAKLGFEAGKHFIPITPEAAEEEVQRWLKKPIARRLVARDGHAAGRPHTYAARARQVLRDAGLPIQLTEDEERFWRGAY